MPKGSAVAWMPTSRETELLIRGSEPKQTAEGAGPSPRESAAASSRWGQSQAGHRRPAAFACWNPGGQWRRCPEGASRKTWNSLSSPGQHLRPLSPLSQCYFLELWQRRNRAQRERPLGCSEVSRVPWATGYVWAALWYYHSDNKV